MRVQCLVVPASHSHYSTQINVPRSCTPDITLSAHLVPKHSLSPTPGRVLVIRSSSFCPTSFATCYGRCVRPLCPPHRGGVRPGRRYKSANEAVARWCGRQTIPDRGGVRRVAVVRRNATPLQRCASDNTEAAVIGSHTGGSAYSRERWTCWKLGGTRSIASRLGVRFVVDPDTHSTGPVSIHFTIPTKKIKTC